jgi:hypothetical protein
MPLESDIAVIEVSTAGSFYTEWEVLAYVGPDRAEGELSEHVDGVVRIRYFNRNAEVVEPLRRGS